MRGGLRYPPFAKPGIPVAAEPPREELLPSIDQFVDELPPIEDFLADETAVAAVEPAAAPDEPAPVSVDGASQGWAEGAWQSYDWDSLSSLNRPTPARPRAAESWGDSEWPGEESQSFAGSDASASGTPGAEEIAEALDGIARRIRSGELVIDNLHGMQPEAAMAAALAVLLRMRG
jgi:hypothetical protein